MSLIKRAVKRKNVLIEFTADNIDSTASQEKIIDDLQHKNVQAFLYYCYLLRQRKTAADDSTNFHFLTSGHPLKKFDTKWDGQVSEGYFENFPYRSNMPKIISRLKNMELSDPVTNLLDIKYNQFIGIRNMKCAAVNGNLAKRYEIMNDDVIRCPKHLIDMAAQLYKDPDPYFNSMHNWYYSGNGNMHIICINWIDYILHSEFNKMFISECNKNETTVASEPLAVFECEDNILETIFSPLLIITLRTKHKVIIVKIVLSDTKFQIEKVKEVHSELPFTGISNDSFHQNILYITSLDGQLKIVNLDRMSARTIQLKSKKSLLNNWNTVIGAERTCFTHVSNSFISSYDKRTNTEVQSWTDVRQLTDEIDCNDITVCKYREGTNYLYFGTDHHFFQMDTRKVSNSKLNILQRWTHGMQCAPLYMSICNFDFNKDLFCLSSQWCEDSCVITNGIDSDKTFVVNGICIPYRLPHIRNTLDMAHKKLLCCDLYNPINKRLCSAITGNVLIEQDDKYLIFLQNSLGDITSQILYPEHLEIFIEDNGPEELHAWSSSCMPSCSDFEVSSIVDIASLWKQLKRIPDGFTIGLSSTMPRKARKFKEKEVFDSYENEDVEIGLLDIWTKENEATVNESSIFLHFSDSE